MFALNGRLSAIKVNAFLALLMSRGISFSTQYSPGSAKDSPALQITVNLSPGADFVINVPFGPGGG